MIPDTTDLTSIGTTQQVVDKTGQVDVLIVNLAADNAHGSSVTDADDQTFRRMFEVMVYPLHQLVHTVDQQKGGKLWSSIVQPHCESCLEAH